MAAKQYQVGEFYVNETTDDEYQVGDMYLNEDGAPAPGGAANWFELKPPGGVGSAGAIWSLKP